MPENLGYMGGFECPHYNTICTGTVVCNDIEECINKKSEPRESSYIYEGYSQEYQSLNRDNIPYETPNLGEGSDKGKCGKNCIYCKIGNSCLKCRDGDYSIGSKFNDKNDNNYLYCDLTSNFTEDFYEKYNDIYYPKNIPIVKLTYEKAYGLKFINNKWSFKIKVSSSNLNENEITLVDITLNEIKTNAICIMSIANDENILNCEIKYDGQNIKDKIKLINDENNSQLIWSNLPNEVNLYLEYHMKFINVYGGFYDNKWKFNIFHEIIGESLENIYEAEILLDIKVNNVATTVLCEVTKNSFLKCLSNHDNQNENDNIKLIGNTEPNLGSVYFLQELTEEQKVIMPVSLYIYYESSQITKNNENILTLIIKGKLSDNSDVPVEEETVTGIQLLIIKNEERNIKDIACITKYISREKNSTVILNCAFSFSENAYLEINIDEFGYSNYVQFNRLDNIEINEIEEENDDITQQTQNDIDDKNDNNSNMIQYSINNLLCLFIYFFIIIF